MYGKDKRLLVVLGGSVDFYHNQMNLFKNVEGKTSWIIKRKDFETFEFLVENRIVEVKFCWNPIRDKNYEQFKGFVQTKLKFILHCPAKEFVEKINIPWRVLFLGHCGAFIGKKEEVFLPSKFSKSSFKESVIKKSSEINLNNQIEIDNFL